MAVVIDRTRKGDGEGLGSNRPPLGPMLRGRGTPYQSWLDVALLPRKCSHARSRILVGSNRTFDRITGDLPSEVVPQSLDRVEGFRGNMAARVGPMGQPCERQGRRLKS